MDILDNLIYATYASAMQPIISQGYPAKPQVISDYILPFTSTPPPFNVGSTSAPVFTYSVGQKMSYCAFEDAAAIETAILRHWYDVNAQVNYDSNGVISFGTAPGVSAARYASFELSTTYHLIFAYLIENTRLFQIMERMIEKYLSDEEFGIAEDSRAFNWIQNTERLFFKNDTLRSSNIRSLIRPSADATRRNAYWRMFGMDLAFGDINSPSNGQLPYIKAKTSNQQFVPLFEKYLSEIWQSYINANNSSGINTSDINVVVDLATQLRELLIARRGDVGSAVYANQNLSREEYASVLMSTWFMFVIADDSPIVQFLNCQSSTIGERLIKIGNKVGIPAHTKSQSLFEMAGAAANILRTIEQGGVFDNPTRMPTLLKSLVPPVPPAATENMNFMSDLLTVINNWEKATGHKIKLSDTGYVASVRVQQNGQSAQRPSQPAMN